MLFKWVDYCEKYENEIATWMNDELILLYATDDGIKEDHEYYISQDSWKHNENYFCKVVLEESAVIAVIIILATEGYPAGINPIIVNPKFQNKGYCTKIVGELLNNANEILGFERDMFEAGIDLDNKTSIRAFEKAGFVLAGTYKGGDFTYWVYPASELENYRKYCADSMGDKFVASSTL
jgi:RimJ/RimL family protein N-acetyltransferase